MTPRALTIAGSDPSGGAGIQADLKVFHQFGTYGMSVVTLLTVQNTCQVTDVMTISAEFVLAQLEAVLSDIPPQAAKTGALGNADIIEAVSARLAETSFPLVVDPVMVSKHGAMLLDEDGARALSESLLRHAFLVTPNIPEAEMLAGRRISDISLMEKAAKEISLLGPRHVLVKGGHLEDSAVDVLWSAGTVRRLPSRKIETTHTHGTGCVLSSAITALLAAGNEVSAAVQKAKDYVTEAIASHPGLGKGLGPINMHAKV